MKTIINWRYSVIVLLFALGTLGILLAFGEPVEPTSNAKWIINTIISFIFSIGCFFLMGRLMKRWRVNL